MQPKASPTLGEVDARQVPTPAGFGGMLPMVSQRTDSHRAAYRAVLRPVCPIEIVERFERSTHHLPAVPCDHQTTAPRCVRCAMRTWMRRAPLRSSSAEGCGARLSVQEPVCPKCGRPAPAILSSESSASDLAAGKTASFPKISQSAIETELPRVSSAVNARSVLDDALDPSVTHVLNASDLAASAKASSSRAPRVRKGVVAAVALVIAAVAVVAFFVLDPLHVTPGLVDSIRESAEDMFPSRQQGETTDHGARGGEGGRRRVRYDRRDH